MFVRLYYQEVTPPLLWIIANRRFVMENTERLNEPVGIPIPKADNLSVAAYCGDDAGPLSF